MATQVARVNAFLFHYREENHEVYFHTQSTQSSQFEKKLPEKKILHASANPHVVARSNISICNISLGFHEYMRVLRLPSQNFQCSTQYLILKSLLKRVSHHSIDVDKTTQPLNYH